MPLYQLILDAKERKLIRNMLVFEARKIKKINDTFIIMSELVGRIDNLKPDNSKSK